MFELYFHERRTNVEKIALKAVIKTWQSFKGQSQLQKWKTSFLPFVRTVSWFNQLEMEKTISYKNEKKKVFKVQLHSAFSSLC